MAKDFKDELKKLPKKPGVYIMHDSDDTIIYVGKAVNLYNRVRSYFRENIGRGPKIDRMVSLIDRFEYIVTDSELEALVLENNLIKEHRPKYNTMLMDDKTYPYIKVTVNEDYPRIMICRKMNKDKAKYFGPYTDGQAVREVLDLINKLYGLRTCNKSLVAGNIKADRPCLNYHMNQCMAPCRGSVGAEEYKEKVNKALDFLNGNYNEIKKDIEEKMKKASDELKFEDAIKYRELLGNIKSITQKQKIEDSELGDRDIIGMAVRDEDAVVQVFFVRNGRMTGREHYHMRVTENTEILSDFIRQFYSGTPFIPKEIFLPAETEDAQLIEEWLGTKKESRVHLITPKIGQKEKLVEMASKNAEIILEQDKEKIKREEARTIGAVREIENWLDKPGIIRMEAFDISNTSGFENVASMVVFENGRPKKSDYRKFKIKTVAGPDDYACMKEALTRRFEDMKNSKSGFEKVPDLLLMDGGRGQVNVALDVLNELGLNICVAGMVKDDNHHTRGLYYKNIEIPVDTHSEGFKLITRVQDEAHRFAIEYHRSLRTKDQVHSVLDEIPGVGPGRRRILMKEYTSLDELKNSSSEEITQKTGFPLSVSEKIIEYLKNK